MVIEEKDMVTSVREHMRGGEGSVRQTIVVPKEKLLNARLFARLVLDPGCSIGAHQHSHEVEYYYILQGEGVVTEDDGDHRVRKGDVVVTGWGQSHSIRNSAGGPLELLAVITTEQPSP